MHSRREIALGFTSCYFTPFLSALLMLLIPNTTATHAITYTNKQYGNQDGTSFAYACGCAANGVSTLHSTATRQHVTWVMLVALSSSQLKSAPPSTEKWNPSTNMVDFLCLGALEACTVREEEGGIQCPAIF